MSLKGSAKLEEILTPLLVTAVALVRPDGAILLQKRPCSAVHGGLWEFPGGKVEPGETPEIALVRELQEELGVQIAAETFTPVGFASGLTASAPEGGKGPQRPLVILLYAGTSWRGTPQAHEAEAIAWHRPEAIGDLAMPPLDYPLAEALCRHLNAYS